jgi:hypothetical protein
MTKELSDNLRKLKVIKTLGYNNELEELFLDSLINLIEHTRYLESELHEKANKPEENDY